MPILYDFSYERPKNLADALALMAEHGNEARPIAGGTDVVVNMKYRGILQLVDGAGTEGARYPAARRVPPIDRPKVLVSLAELDDLVGVSVADDTVTVGPRTTMTQFAAREELPAGVEALRDAASIMGSPLIRNRATIGGNLVNARPAADTAVALIALGAELTLANHQGSRQVNADEFITAPGKTVRKPDELVTSIEIPIGPVHGSAYLRQGTRKQLEIALVGVASSIKLDPESGAIADARICLGAVGPTPLLALQAGKEMVGEQPSPALFVRAAEVARSEAKPIDDFRGSAAYRLDLIEVMTRRTLETSVARAKGQGGGR